MVKAPTVISTFAGCGGSSLGYKWAGFRELLAIDFDDNSVETFKLNFPDVPCWKRDIREVMATEILEVCNIKPGELDVLDGSPPCQGFSTAGKREVLDPRNDLFKEYVRLIRELQPRVFVMENVSGMVKGTMRGRFIEIMLALKSTGYNVKAKLMNAKYYEVPQSRQRMIFIGAKSGEPTFPKPSHHIISVGEALGINGFLSDGFKESSSNRPARMIRSKRNISISTRSQKINPWMNGANGAAMICAHPGNYEIKIEKPVDTSGTPKFDDKYARLYSVIKNGQNASDVIGKSGYQCCVKPRLDRPSPTLPKMQTGRGFATVVHPIERRALSIGEAKRLCSFPDDFKLIGPYSTQWARLGNAVMPKFMFHIARHVRETLLGLKTHQIDPGLTDDAGL